MRKRDDYDDLKNDYLTALNYHRVVDGFQELKERFFKAHEEYYNELLDIPVVKPKGLELRIEEV